MKFLFLIQTCGFKTIRTSSSTLPIYIYIYIYIYILSGSQYNCHHLYHKAKIFYANCWLLYCCWTMCFCHTASYNITLVCSVFAIVLSCALVVFRHFRKIAKSAYELRPPVGPHRITRLPLNGFSWNSTFGYFSIICHGYSNLIKIGQ